ncbi:hypothetical protein AAFO92_02410 [Roseovarius sp. CAU 1744]|uniref:hypothetical protein n=1 Tax=Roseovarius sp. CAU 1744 TaxID=3140368 RepID=UPI00325C0C6D
MRNKADDGCLGSGDMHIECHNAQILYQWSANEDRLLSGAVLVEFTLHDDTGPRQRLRSKLVEYVCFQTEPGDSETHKIRRLERRAYEQVMRYFEGEGERENLFADGPDPAQHVGLSPEDEADLVAELRKIELEFDYA